jgi:alcohol dehydrogenase
MQSLQFVAAHRVEWQELPAPAIEKPGDALVRPLAAAACDLDAAILAGLTPYAPPFALGHEFVGEILEAGDDAGVQAGDRVMVPFQISCGSCAFCRRDLTANCTSVPRTSMYGIGEVGGSWGGAFSDVVRVPYARHMLLPLPGEISPSIAARLGDNVADGYRAVADGLARVPGAPVLVLCGGPKGSVPLYAALAALALGAATVDFYDGNTGRLEIAASLGATPHDVEKWPRRVGAYPVTVDATQQPDGLACALRSTEPGGICTSTSMYFEPLVGVPMTEMYMKGATLTTGRVQSRVLLPEVVELVRSGRLDPGRVPAQEVEWTELSRALLDFDTKLVAVRAG